MLIFPLSFEKNNSKNFNKETGIANKLINMKTKFDNEIFDYIFKISNCFPDELTQQAVAGNINKVDKFQYLVCVRACKQWFSNLKMA